MFRCIFCKKETHDELHDCLGNDWSRHYSRLDFIYPSIGKANLKTVRETFSPVPLEQIPQLKPTPLVRLKIASEQTGGKIFLKFEGANPTGSFKDRGSVLTVEHASRNGYKEIALVTTGSAGVSMSHWAGRKDITTTIYAPATIPKEKLEKMLYAGAKVELRPGTYEKLYRQMIDSLHELPKTTFLSSFGTDPYFSEGFTNIAYEIVEAGVAPDLVIAPVGTGASFSAIWRGFKQLHAAGLSPKMPKMIAVQMNGGPVYEGYKRKKFNCPLILNNPPHHIAKGLLSREAYDYFRTMNTIRESHGDVVGVAETNIAKDYFKYTITDSAACKHMLEPTSWSVFSALKNIRTDGKTIVLIGTGNAKNALSAVEENVPNEYKPFFRLPS